MSYPQSWSTKAEIHFIRGIGKNQKNMLLKGIPRLQLLENYFKSMELRRDWTKIDRKQIFSFVKSEIKKEKEIP